MEIVKKINKHFIWWIAFLLTTKKRMIPYQWYSTKYFYHKCLTYCHTRKSTSYTIQ